jgi:single-stranded-DNA-specific exonuclease
MPDSIFIEQSLNKSAWVIPEIDANAVERIMREHEMPEIVARLLCARNVPPENIQRFLFPTLKNDFPDPFSLMDMRGAAEFIADAIRRKKNIVLFGDFDVDGATSSALMHRFLKHFGVDAPIYIPDRLTEGYGPNAEALQELKNNGAEIVILMDCGTAAFDVVTAGREMGLDIIIVDHHEAEEKLPPANFIINPKRRDDTSGLSMMAACGVTFMVCVAVNNVLRSLGPLTPTLSPMGRGSPAGTGEGVHDEPPLKDWLDLVALGTVCDMVPITGVNRLFVRLGFQNMKAQKNPGIRALLEVAKSTGDPTPFTAGFVIGPRINAGGRIHKSDLGAKLLSTDDADEAKNIAWLLNDCNDKRKDMQVQTEQEAQDKVERMGLDQHPAIIVGDAGWHPGLVGLVANKLKDKYARPACVIAFDENGVGKGSGRSVAGVHIAQVFMDAKAAGLLDKGGGHAMAGGFTLPPGKFDEFCAFVFEHVKRQSRGLTSAVQTMIDGLITARGARVDFVRLINDHVGPFGQGAPEPLFMMTNARIHTADIVGSSHVRAMISDAEGGTRIKAVAFKAVGTPLGDALLKQGRRAFHICGHLKINEWQGRESVEMHIKDAAFADANIEQISKAF